MAVLQKVAADKGIELPNNDELELALFDQFGPPKGENRLPSPSGFVDSQSESDHSSDDEPVPTALSEDEVEEPDLPAPRMLLESIPRRTNRHHCAKNKQRSWTKGLTSGTSHPRGLFAQRF